MLKPIVALLAVLSITALTGCSNFNSAFKNALKDRQASPPLQHDPIARLEQKQRLVTVGDSISFDASRSLSKRDLPLTYRWFLLERPHGSQAQLQKDGELAQLQIDQPGEYRVSLVVNDGAFDSYPFEALVSTNKDKLDNVSFIVIGDAGTGSKQQYHVAAAIEQICQKKVCDFALGLGDNIYNAGPDSVTDSQFQEKFEKPYQQLNFPFYMVLGNHDSSGLMAGDGGFNARGGIEVEYSQHSQKWTMPERYYRITAPLGENPRQNPSSNPQPLAEFFALDSTPLTSAPDIVPKFHIDRYTRNQEAWLNSGLHNSKAQWKIAFAHHPYISNGKHGNAGNYDDIARYTKTVSKVLPKTNRFLFQRVAGLYYQQFLERQICDRVDLFLAGHDHNMQWLPATKRCGKTEFIISGAAAKSNSLKDPERNPSRWQASRTTGFFHIEIIGNQLTAEIYRVAKGSDQPELAYRHTIDHSSNSWQPENLRTAGASQ